MSTSTCANPKAAFQFFFGQQTQNYLLVPLMGSNGPGHMFFGHEPILVSATQDETTEQTPRASTAPTLAIVPASASQAPTLPVSGVPERSGPYQPITHSPTTADLFAALHDLQASMFTMQASYKTLQAGMQDLQHRMDDMQRHLSHIDRRVTQTKEQADELDNSNFNAHARITDTAANMREIGRSAQNLQDRQAQLSTDHVQLQRPIGHALHLTGSQLLNQQ